MRSDTELLDFIEERGTPGFQWLCRESLTGRGYRLHQTRDCDGFKTAREAIMAVMGDKEREAQ